MLSSRTTREIIDIAVRYGYGKFSWAFLRPWVEEHEDRIEIVYDDDDVPADVRAFLTERDVTFTAALVPLLLGRRSAMRIETKLSASSAPALREALPWCDFRFEAERNAQVLDLELLDAPLPHADPQAMRVCELQCEQLLARRTQRSGVAAAVRAMLVRTASERGSLEEIARARSVDPRTLRRQLQSEGTSFRALVDEVKETLATALLQTGALTVEEVADRLGYAEAASFTRAYKRWTGRTPGAVVRNAGRSGR